MAASQLSDYADIVTATTADPVAFISARVPFTELKPVIVNVGRDVGCSNQYGSQRTKKVEMLQLRNNTLRDNRSQLLGYLIIK